MILAVGLGGTMIVMVIGLIWGLSYWGQNQMKGALSQLSHLQNQALGSLNLMGCNCQQKKKDPNLPCSDPKEESYRVAFVNETKKTTQLHAQVQDFQKRLEISIRAGTKSAEEFDRRLLALETYVKDLLESLPQNVSENYLKQNGPPPFSMKIS